MNKEILNRESLVPLDWNVENKPSFFISGEIGEETANEMLNWLGYWGVEYPQRQLSIFIDSVGGEVIAAVTIAEAFKISPNPIRTIVTGRCYSAGALIVAAGDKGERYAYPRADFMIHEVRLSGEIDESITDLEETTRQTKRWHDIFVEMLAGFTGKSTEQIKKDMKRKEKYMAAEEALKYGLIDNVVLYKK